MLRALHPRRDGGILRVRRDRVRRAARAPASGDHTVPFGVQYDWRAGAC